MSVAQKKLAGKRAVLSVGDGRGFVVESSTVFKDERLIITAAHCLPSLPPCHPGAYLEELTYGKLLGPLNGKCTIAVECRFADPIADIAVLGPPDNQVLDQDAEAYDLLVDNMATLTLADAPAQAFEVSEGIRYPSPVAA